MLTPLIAIVIGLVVLVWSADRFVVGASAAAKQLRVSPLLIGMVIVGFGTSMPEMVVSVMASLNGNPSLALGNALGSNIVNIGLILGLTALIAPIAVSSNIVRRELPLLMMAVLLFGLLILDGDLSRFDASVLMCGFALIIGWSLYSAMTNHDDALQKEVEQELRAHSMSLRRALLWSVIGLSLLIVSSRVLVWGAVVIAQKFGVSDLVIGLTIIGLGTSFPELATSLIAAFKGEHDIAIGNVVGSNIFNILAVAGVAGMIQPAQAILPIVLTRDWATMTAMTLALLVMGYGFKRPGRINRFEGGLLLLGYIGYTVIVLALA